MKMEVRMSFIVTGTAIRHITAPSCSIITRSRRRFGNWLLWEMAAFIKTRGEQYKLKPDASLSEALDVVNASEGGWLAEITDQT